MSWLDGLTHRLRTVLRSDAYDRDLREELDLHRDLRAAQRGPHARRFGNATWYTEETRRTTWLGALDPLSQDLRYALRGLRRRPAFAAGVILTLGLGIGANAVMFGVTDRLLFRSPPMLRDQSTVHRLYRTALFNGERRIDRNLAFAEFLDVRERTTAVFSRVTAFQTQNIAVGDGADARERGVTLAGADYFEYFNVVPVLGRLFTAADDSVGAPPVAVLGHGFWLTHFGGRNVVGEQLRVGSRLLTIVGVAPPGFVGISDQGVPAVFTPITPYAYSRAGPDYSRIYRWTWMEMIARRRPEVSEAAAASATEAAFIASWRKATSTNRPRYGAPEEHGIKAVLAPVQMGRGPQASRDAKVARWVSGVAGIVLLIACANVANLMLARAVARRREIALRRALGVSRGRLVRQLLTESLVLALSGGALGLVVARWGGAAIRALYLSGDEAAGVFTDVRTLAFAALVTVAAAILAGGLPALSVGRGDLMSSLKAGEREGGERRGTLRRGILVFQAALSVILLVGAGLFVRSLNNARGARIGYDTSKLMIADVAWRGIAATSEQNRELRERFLEASRAMAGVERAALAESAPFYSHSEPDFHVPGIDSVARLGRFLAQVATPGYFATMGTRILRGRALTEDDRANGPGVVVLSDAMAKLFWPGEDPLGKCVRVDATDGPCTTVVGVAEDIRLATFAGGRREFTYYLPSDQWPDWPPNFLVVRTTGEAADLAPALRTRLQTLTPAPAWVNVIPLSQLVDPNYRSWTFGATMFAAFGGLALLLAAIGLYSVIAYEVAQRTREMSVRIALGAPAGRVVGMVITSGVSLVGGGIAIGLAVAAWVAPSLGDLMFGVEPRDLSIFGGVAVTLLGISVVATAGPAMRAARVDPAQVLRSD